MGVETAKLPMVLVDPSILDTYLDISFLCERLSEGVPPDVPLAVFVFFRTPNPSDGCVLVSAFHHVLGDATCYARFLKSWSAVYEANCKRSGYVPHPISDIPKRPCTKADLRRGHPKANPSNSFTARRYFFTESQLKNIKGTVIGSSNPLGISTNDVLIAQAACALGPGRRAEISGGPNGRDFAYIALLADHRGRGLDETQWGNGTVDLSIFVPWTLIMEGNVAAVAQSVREQIKSEFHMLQNDLDAFNKHRFASAKNKRLFCWNSWQKAGRDMCTSNFGGSLCEFEWLNLLHHVDIDTVLTVPSLAQFGDKQLVGGSMYSSLSKALRSGGMYLAIQISCKDNQEVARLSQMWGDGATVTRVQTAMQC